jgi:T-complex protein 1 subunit beta
MLLNLALVCAGCSEMLMAEAVSQLAAQTAGKEAIAMEAFARSLRMVRMVVR